MEPFSAQLLHSPIVPYVYNYPPTRLYKALPAPSLPDLICTPRVHVYIHIPFCEQKCTFCGYLTVIDAGQKMQARYVEALCQELQLYAPLLEKHDIASINFGGGTPSLLSPDEIGRILSVLRGINPWTLRTVTEISIEATPETITVEKCLGYRAQGINRVSIGVQTFNDQEIGLVHRGNAAGVSRRAYEILRSHDFQNVCVDLMYGLPGQTPASWQDSVEAAIALRPATVELYSTVTIPGTALARQETTIDDTEKRRWYDLAQEKFLAAGYRQECHLRFVLPGRGGYEQQAGVYALETLIGVGVGARSYTERFHYRNVYDTRRSRDALRNYIAYLENGRLPIESGFNLTENERMRRYVIHRFEELDTADFMHRFGQSLEETFPEEIAALIGMNCWKNVAGRHTIHPRHLRFRDTLAHEFFSREARSSEQAYYADELISLRR